MEGTVKEPKTNTQGKIVGYNIRGNDGKTYYAHLGDIQENEKLLYALRDHEFTKIQDAYDHFSDLTQGRPVEFEVWGENQGSKLHAYNVTEKA
jgi:hypothetical protein